MIENKIAVFGSTGFIGKNLSEHLYKQGLEVISIGRSESSAIVLDLEQPVIDSVAALGIGDSVVFLAAISSPEFCATDYESAFRVNVTNTILVIRRLLDAGVRVLFSSSDVVYGRTDNIVDESSIVNPSFEYAEMKETVEAEFLGCDNFHIMRLSYVWSIHDKFTRFIIDSAKSDKAVEIFDPFIRSIISLADVLDFICSFLGGDSSFPKLVNLAGPEFLSRVDLVVLLRTHIAFDYYVGNPPDNFFEYRPDQILMGSSRLESSLGRLPSTIEYAIATAFKNYRV